MLLTRREELEQHANKGEHSKENSRGKGTKGKWLNAASFSVGPRLMLQVCRMDGHMAQFWREESQLSSLLVFFLLVGNVFYLDVML